MNREQWLNDMAAILVENLLAPHGHAVPEFCVSVGWPGGRSRNGETIGECWTPDADSKGVTQIFISPAIGDDSVNIAATLLHELIHASVGVELGHGKEFKAAMRDVGLEGNATATVAGDALTSDIQVWVETLGDFPGSRLDKGQTSKKKQKTNMLKVWCEDTLYIARTTRRWLDLYGTPLCPCHNRPMRCDD